MPSLTAAAGGLSLCADHLAAMLADCPSFQAFANNAADATAAALRIHHNAINEDVDENGVIPIEAWQRIWPFGLIFTEGRRGYGIDFLATGVSVERGLLGIELAQAVPKGIAEDEASRRFENTVGQIIDDLRDPVRRETPGFLNWNRLDVLVLGRAEHDKLPGIGDHYFTLLAVQHGLS